MQPKYTVNPTQYTSQDILNESFNLAFKMLQMGNMGFDTVTDAFQPMQAQIPYDYAAFTNQDANDNPQTITFYSGGSGGTIVSTLSLTFDSSSNVQTIARS